MRIETEQLKTVCNYFKVPDTIRLILENVDKSSEELFSDKCFDIRSSRASYDQCLYDSEYKDTVFEIREKFNWKSKYPFDCRFPFKVGR